MAIEYSKVAASRPSAFEIRLGDVHDDGYPIFVIVLNESMKGINCVSFDCSIAAFNKFDGLYPRNSGCFLLLVLIHLFLTIIYI